MIITKGEIKQICFDVILKLWETESDFFPDFLTEICGEQKQQNEIFLEEMKNKWRKTGKSFPEQKREQAVWKQKTDDMLSEFLEREQILGIKKYMSQELFAGY